MGENAVELEDVSKRYFLGEHHGMGISSRDAVANAIRRASHRAKAEEIWSLRDVSLEIAEGDVVGVIGANGAGKSTLLKIVSRITEPTSGVSRTRGRVGSLLEVGTGFHPELTGRENVFLCGAILGMSRRQTEQRFDEIVEFAEVHQFVDTPAKRFSAGMLLRLAFSVAAHLDAEILVVDEVLAVGDAEFQRRCLAKMGDVERSGRTILFVSHNLDAIVQLCPRSIWLEQGCIVSSGPSQDVLNEYLASGIQHMEIVSFPVQPDAAAQLESVSVIDSLGNPSTLLRRDEPFTIELAFLVREALPGLDFSVVVKNLRGLRILDHAWSDHTPDPRGGPGRYLAKLSVPPVLHAGDYRLGVWIGTPYETLVWEDLPLTLRLEGSSDGRSERILNLPSAWDVRRDP
jgi:ABC-type polysaccharide/polyol phosphate transport system ATPase subunit